MDYGFVPGTRGADGEPLDAMVLVDQSTFPGCLVEARIIGVLTIQSSDSRPEQKREGDLGWTEQRHGEKFGHRRKELGSVAGGQRLGRSLYEVPPGRTAFPRHYHLAEKEELSTC